MQVEGMTLQMMETVADHWAEAAWVCKSLGFQMINLHGGHGWLLNQFISPRFNHRTDEFGGSMENRARFPIMVCKRSRRSAAMTSSSSTVCPARAHRGRHDAGRRHRVCQDHSGSCGSRSTSPPASIRIT